MERYPAIAVLAAMFYALTGKAAYAERWADVAHRGAAATNLPDGSPSLEPWLALIRALLCRDGVEQMQADAELAATTLAPGSFWRITSMMYQAAAHLMAGDLDRADVLFEAVVAEGQGSRIMFGPCIALAERSLLAIARDDWDLGKRYLSEARSVAREGKLEDYPSVAILYAVAARMALHEADRPRAEAELTRAQRLRPGLTYAVPHMAVQARIELARCYLALSDFGAARTLLREADEILVRRPRLGVFVQQAADLRAELSRARGPSALGASALTTAELRLLPMLSTHLSFPEIAEEMFLSRHTVKAEAMSIYRKLGASSRSQAVGRARELALLDK
jgi:LuxR family maltose regulon positive regulatory protein